MQNRVLVLEGGRETELIRDGGGAGGDVIAQSDVDLVRNVVVEVILVRALRAFSTNVQPSRSRSAGA